MSNSIRNNSVIWNIDMHGSSYFIVDIWKTKIDDRDEVIGEIDVIRIVCSSFVLKEINYRNDTKLELLDMKIENRYNGGYVVSLNTEIGVIKLECQGYHEFNLKGSSDYINSN